MRKHVLYPSILLLLEPKQSQTFSPNTMMTNTNNRPQTTKHQSPPSYGTLPSSSSLHADRQSNEEDTSYASTHNPLPLNNTQKSSTTSKIILISTLSTLILLITTLAQSQLIPSLYYTNTADLLQDILVTLFAAAASTILINTISYFSVSTQSLSTRDSRKLIHTLSAPFFCLLWPLYSHNPLGSQLFASSVVLTQTFKLILAGLGKGGQEEESLAQAVSRQGSKEEALGGPLIYCIVLLSVIGIFWHQDMASAIMTLSTMAAGDGMADIIGRRLGTVKWPWSPNKSIVGTCAFIGSSTLCAGGLFYWFHFMGDLSGLSTVPLSVSASSLPWLVILGKIFFISTVCALVELSTVLDDNITVPLTAAILSSFLL